MWAGECRERIYEFRGACRKRAAAHRERRGACRKTGWVHTGRKRVNTEREVHAEIGGCMQR
jgi:hypothetical protein